MTEELQTSIERLYITFASYPFRSKMDRCPCCVSDIDIEKIHTKQLRKLDGDDLSRYAFKAITTWGNTEDFKHYLPRIFELLSSTDFLVDTFVVLGKLNVGKWKTWPTEEQNAIRDFLINWWINITKFKLFFDKEALVEIYKLLDDLDPLLDNWVISFNDNSFKNLIDCIENYYYDLTNKSYEFKEVDKSSINKLAQWLSDKKEIIENGFFYFANIDKAFAEKISNTLYIMERIN